MTEVIPATEWEIIKRFLREKRTGRIALNVHKGSVASCEVTERKIREDRKAQRSEERSGELDNR